MDITLQINNTSIADAFYNNTVISAEKLWRFRKDVADKVKNRTSKIMFCMEGNKWPMKHLKEITVSKFSSMFPKAKENKKSSSKSILKKTRLMMNKMTTCIFLNLLFNNS